VIYKQRMIECGRQLSNPRVAGSIPAAPTILSFLPVTQATYNFPSSAEGSTQNREISHQTQSGKSEPADRAPAYKSVEYSADSVPSPTPERKK
jgi:hypothetical protein